MTSGGRTLLQLLVVALFVSLGVGAKAETGDRVGPLAYAQPVDTREFFVVVEIPAGSFTKYEIEPQSGFVIVDRFQQMPVVYPANYGSVASSLAGDGDHLDALVLTREPVIPGALIRVRTIGLLRMIDGGEPDHKLITVPVPGVDPTYDPLRSIGDLPEIERQRIAAFFGVYKNLPAGRKIVELGGFGDAEEAQRLVDAAIFAGRSR